ncbi:hypothetical protein AZE42_10247 [Rhizopogon vesiculosus]|uniref:hAT-like transposase RNase-H fold domain-containing protein n=1 Tax=Rhizopogon vesiculosus TaxID=180088 RepID=A0A1J8PTU4_9AGAM|nr:hypothetical protein AZE42_10247 [Rhizopogon vesiculosus]
MSATVRVLQKKLGVPDLLLEVDGPGDNVAMLILEVAFMQREEHLMKKIRRFATKCETIQIIVIIDVCESPPYRRPKDESELAVMMESPLIIKVNAWLRHPDGEFWIEETNSSPYYACAQICPTQDSTEIAHLDSLFRQAMKLIRDKIIGYVQEHCELDEDPANFSAMCKWMPPDPLFNWDEFVVADDQAINLIECVEFRYLLLLLPEELREQDIPRRTKLQELIHALGDISLTTDIWSDDAHKSFLAMTAHWIVEMKEMGSLELKVALIAFHQVKGSHTDITVKIGHITLDNAENNAMMMLELERLLGEREIEFSAQDRRIRCFPHTINICVGHILDSFSDIDPADLEDALVGTFADDSDDDGSGSGGDSDKYLKAIKCNPVELGHQTVKAIHASGQQHEEFVHLIESCNSSGLFKLEGKVVQVPQYQLLWDVSMRWDSTYFMINHLRALCVAIDHFVSSLNHKKILEHKMDAMDWVVLHDFESILEIPHGVQQSMSSESHPRLGRAVPHLELFMSAWEKKAQKIPHLKPFIDVGLKWAEKYYKRMDDTCAYVVAMFVDPSIQMNWVKACWEKAWIRDAEKKIIELVGY